MALIKCKECGEEISSGAAFCPHCGYKNETRFCPDCGKFFFVFRIGNGNSVVEFPIFDMAGDRAVGFCSEFAESFALKEVFIGEGFKRTAAVGIFRTVVMSVFLNKHRTVVQISGGSVIEVETEFEVFGGTGNLL